MKYANRILHIVNWYPNPLDPYEAPFVKDQIDALHRRIQSDVLLIQIRFGKTRLINVATSDRERVWIFQCPIQSWFIKEVLTSVVLFYFLFVRYDLSKYRLINFHIAYPLLTYYHFFKRWIRVPAVITEHWSAYYFNFGVSKNLGRVKRIFANRLPVITVSASLAADIARFAGMAIEPLVVPNVVDERFVENPGAAAEGMRFFMLGGWKFPKMPLVVIDALSELSKQGSSFSLRIGGYGPYEETLKARISELGMGGMASFVGKLSREEAAREMQMCSFFVHASDYETFSVVCAEALCCGTPVVASSVGGIPEFVNDSNGILVAHNTVENWISALRRSFSASFDHTRIARSAQQRFSSDAVGEQYRQILNSLNPALDPSGKRVLIISPEPWQHFFVSKHHYAIALADRGYTVFFLNPPGGADAVTVSPYPGLYVVDYRIGIRGLNYLPEFASRILSRPVVKRILSLIGGAVDVVWSFDPYRFQSPDLFSSQACIYFAADFHASRGLERRIANNVQFVLSPSPSLLDMIETSTPKYFINHALADHFISNPARADMPGFNSLKIGYVGNLQSHYLDQNLLRRVINENQHCDFVFAGDELSVANELRELSNAYFVGRLSTHDVPAFLNGCDGLLLCYDTLRFEREVSNAHKIMEYLASGRVVMSTRIRQYNDKPELVLVPDSNDGLPVLVRDVTNNISHFNSPVSQQKRKAFALEHTYRHNVDIIEEWIKELNQHRE